MWKLYMRPPCPASGSGTKTSAPSPLTKNPRASVVRQVPMLARDPDLPTHPSPTAPLPASTAPIPTPSVLQPAHDEKKPLTSGQVGAILACITLLVIGVLCALHLLLARRRRRRSHGGCDTDSSGGWSSRATRERESFERVEVNWGSGRRAPKRHEVRAYERVVPVYSNVRHVRRPPATYFR